MIDANIQALINGNAIGDMNPLPVKKSKGQTVTLFGGAISASVAEANATIIDMTDYTNGSLEFVVNSGTGTFSIAVYAKETNTGTFYPLNVAKQDGTGTTAYPAIATTASTSASYSLYGLNANYIKFVPTLTGTANVTLKFTPCN